MRQPPIFLRRDPLPKKTLAVALLILLWTLPLRGEKWVFYTHQNSGFPEAAVWAMLKDKEGRYWFGTGGGLLLFSQGKWTLFTPKNTSGALKGKSVVKVFRDSRGVFWFATRRSFLGGGGVTRYAGKEWTLLDKERTGGGLPSDYVWDIVEDGQGRLWFATDKGVSCYDGERWYLYNRTNTGLGLPGDSVWDIFLDGKGGLWFATDKGVGWFNGREWRNLTKYNSGLPRTNISVVYQDKDGHFWFGSRSSLWGGGGLIFYDGARWKVYTKKNTHGGLPHNDINVIFEDSEGTLWVGTRRGVGRFQKGKWKAFLVGEPVWDIMEDGGNLLFAVSRGVAVMVKGTLPPWGK